MILTRRPFLVGLSGICACACAAAPGRPGPLPPGFPEIAGDGIAAALAGSVLSLSYRLPAALVEGLGPRPHEATVVVAVESRGPLPFCRCLGRGAVPEAVPESGAREGASLRFHARVDVKQLLELPATPAVYHVHAALFQHRSPVLRLALG